MPFVTYNLDIPDAPNDPSVDQGLMKTNTNAVDQLIDVDHFAFNDNLGGYHKQVTFVEEAAPGIGTADAVLFGGVNSADTWPHWQNATTGVTGVLMLNGVPSAGLVGWTYLPGGVVMQWGFHDYAPNVNAGSITFTIEGGIAFNTNIFNIQLTINASAVPAIKASTVSTTGFTWNASTTISRIYWVALGN